MEVILINKIEGSKIIENCVQGFKKAKIIQNGKRQWCYIVYLEFWTKTYPCNRYEIHSITKR